MKDIINKQESVPVRSNHIVWTEFIALCDCEAELLTELLETGWISPVQETREERLFSSNDVYRVRKLCRICADFELPPVGGAIIVDLLKRISVLEQHLGALKKECNK